MCEATPFCEGKVPCISSKFCGGEKYNCLCFVAVVVIFCWCWCWCWCSSRRRPPALFCTTFSFSENCAKALGGNFGLDAFVATTNVSSSVEDQSLLSLYFLLSFLRLCSARKYCSPKYACAFNRSRICFSRWSRLPSSSFLVIIVVVVVVVAGVPLSSVLVVARFSSSKFTIFFVFLRVFK